MVSASTNASDNRPSAPHQSIIVDKAIFNNDNQHKSIHTKSNPTAAATILCATYPHTVLLDDNIPCSTTTGGHKLQVMNCDGVEYSNLHKKRKTYK